MGRKFNFNAVCSDKFIFELPWFKPELPEDDIKLWHFERKLFLSKRKNLRSESFQV